MSQLTQNHINKLLKKMILMQRLLFINKVMAYGCLIGLILAVITGNFNFFFAVGILVLLIFEHSVSKKAAEILILARSYRFDDLIKNVSMPLHMRFREQVRKLESSIHADEVRAVEADHQTSSKPKEIQ